MSVNCVPPGRTSPYQNGAGASANPASLNPARRHAVVSGEDASALPRRKRQVELVENKVADWAGTARHSRPMSRRRVNMGQFLTQASPNCTAKVTIWCHEFSIQESPE